MPQFDRYIGIDYSGAETANASLKAIRVYLAVSKGSPTEEKTTFAFPGHSNQPIYWSRQRLAEWLREELLGGPPTIVGIDHAFSFPLAYFEKHQVPLDWPAFLDQLQRHCPVDQPNLYVESIREGVVGSFGECDGDSRWLRLTECWTASAKSVFRFDVQGAVAKASYSGIPWLRYLRQECHDKVHFWPFDGWTVPPGKSAVAEVYPSLWSRRFPKTNRNAHQHDAYSVAAWLQRADLTDFLPRFLQPPLDQHERNTAQIEGWILGVT